MSFLPAPSIFLKSVRSHDTLQSSPPHRQGSQQRALRTSSSLATLVQFARNPLVNTGEILEDWYDGSTKEERAARQAVEDRKQLLYVKLRTATIKAAWEAAAMDLDEIEGNNSWKASPESADYDATLVQARLKQMTEARISCDIGRMLFLVRTSLTRNLGDMGNQQMYRHSHVGTKDLIENYITATLDTLEALLDVSAKAKCDGMESRYILEQLLSSRQAFGRSALLLSGGATFGMNHIGVLKALWEARLLPRIISGASAGSIVCAVICTRSDEEVPNLLDTFCDGSLDVFEEEGSEDGLLRKVARFLKHGALYDIEHLTRIMKDLLGDITFQEAYNRTRKILNITVSSASLYELPRLLNYITAPNVLIWSAVAASCSVPFVYTSASLLAKDPKSGEAVTWNPTPQRWIDGSVDNDIPMTRLAEMFNVNHFIVSQVNPHVVPFLMKEEGILRKSPQEATLNPPAAPSWLDGLSHLAKDEALHRMHILTELGVFPNLLTKVISVLSQKYSGDITILPEISYADFPRMLSNPTPEFMQQAMLAGERATWPKISIIKNHCAIELALDDAVQKLRTRVVFSPVETESRKGAHVKRNSLTGSHRTVRKRTNNGRPLSQASAQEPLQGRPPSSQSDHRRSPLSVLDPRNPNQIPRLRHKKSRSLNTVLARPTSSQNIVSKAQPSIADIPAQPQSSQEITSSGAEEETSNHPSRTSSSTSLNLSSPYESQSSMGESPPSRWHRSLFGSSSQPNTPIQRSSISSSPTTPKASTHPGLTMTPTQSSKSGSESKYKRMFLPKQQKQKQKSATEVQKPTSSASARPSAGSGGSGGESSQPSHPGSRRNWGLEIDIPSTARGLVGRGAKNKETTRSP